MSHNRCLTLSLLVGCGVLLAGCNEVATVDDVITESNAVVDDRFLGDWVNKDGDRAHVKRGQGKDYVVAYVDKDDSVQMRARLGRLEVTLVVDVYPEMASYGPRNKDGIPMHSVYAIDLYGDSVAIRGLDGDSVLKRLASGKIRTPYSKIEEMVLLHGDPAGVRSAVSQLVRQSALLHERSVYRRVRAR